MGSLGYSMGCLINKYYSLDAKILVNAEYLYHPAKVTIIQGVQYLDVFYSSRIRIKLT